MLQNVLGRLESLTRQAADRTLAVFSLSNAESHALLVSLLKAISDESVVEVRSALSLADSGARAAFLKIAQVEVASDAEEEIKKLRAEIDSFRAFALLIFHQLSKRPPEGDLNLSLRENKDLRAMVNFKVGEVVKERELAAQAFNLLAKATEIK